MRPASARPAAPRGALLLLAASLAAAAAPAAEDSIETIVVTARKRAETLQDVPVAVSAFDAAGIAARRIRSIEDFARLTPGLSFAKAFGRTNERPVIRGLGNVLAGVQFGVESGAAYFVDGVYYPGDLESLDMQSLQRIEVIRGPQSALFGRNTYAGAINFVSRPAPERPAAEVRVSYGQDEDLDAHVMLGGPLTERLAGTLTARHYDFDGEYTNVVTGATVGDEQTTSLSGTIELAASGNLRLRSRLTLQRDRDGTRAFFLQPSELNNCYPGTRSNAAWPITGSSNNNQYYCGEIGRPHDWVALNDAPAAGDAWLVPGIPDVPFPGGDPYNPAQGVAFSGVERDLVYVNAVGDWTAGGWTLTGAAAWRDEDRRTGTDADHSAINLVPQPGAECTLCGSETDHFRDYALELRLASPSAARLRWMAGAFWYEQDAEGSDVTFARPHGGPVNEREKTENRALFGMLEYDFTDVVTATLEGRWFHEDKSLYQDATVSPTSIPVYDETIDFEQFAPRLTVKAALQPDLLVYAAWARGYKPGGLNGKGGLRAANPAPTYGQETSTSYEVGLKSTLLDGRLAANIGAFFMDVDDIQLTTPLPTASGQLITIVTNQGSGEVRGLEAELQYAVSETWSVGASYALADTAFTEGCDEVQWTLTSGGGLLDDFAHCRGNDVNGRGNGSIEGHRFPLAPRHQASAFADFRRAIGGGVELVAGADTSWEDERPVQVHNLAWVPAALIVNARIGLASQRWEATVYGRNLGDEDAPSMVSRTLQEPLVSGVAGTPSTTAAGAAPGACPPGTCATSYPRAFFGDMRRGRNVGVEVVYRFGG
jgi:outer membrane receptor protein involved in Fe transport